MTNRCPSDLALEQHLLDPAASPLLAHVEVCPLCRHRVARMLRDGEDFRRYVFPGSVERVEAAAARDRRRWLPFVLAPAGAAVAIAAGLLLVARAPPGPPAGYEGGVKGGSMTLAVYTTGDQGVRALADGAAVPAAAALRFKVGARDCAALWLFSVDAAGQVTRLHPAAGDAAPPPAGGELPGGAVLDGQAGPERIYAVCAERPLPWEDVARAAREAAGGGAVRVRAGAALPGLPPGTAQATLLLEKRP